jgi:hypothetical protein
MDEIGLHEVVRPAMEFGLADRRPMEALEQRRVRALHVGEEALAAPCVSR